MPTSLEAFFRERFQDRAPEPGDEDELLERLWDQFGRAVFAFALSRSRDRDTALEVCQETFVAAIRSVRSDPVPRGGTAHYRSWLLTIARNKLTDHRRRRSNSEEALESLDGDSDRSALVPDPAVADALEEASKAEWLEALRRCIEELPGNWRQLVMLIDLEQEASTAVAARIGKQPGNVRVTLHRARKRLRVCIEERLGPAAVWGT